MARGLFEIGCTHNVVTVRFTLEFNLKGPELPQSALCKPSLQ